MPRKTASKIVIDLMKDGRSFTTAELLRELRKIEPDITAVKVRVVVGNLRKDPPPGFVLATRRYGRDATYRLVPPFNAARCLNQRMIPFLNNLDNVTRMALMGSELATVVRSIVQDMRGVLNEILDEMEANETKNPPDESTSTGS